MTTWPFIRFWVCLAPELPLRLLASEGLPEARLRIVEDEIEGGEWPGGPAVKLDLAGLPALDELAATNAVVLALPPVAGP